MLRPTLAAAVQPKALTVYLGDFASPPTPAQARLLAQCSLTVLDPLRVGAVEAAAARTGVGLLLARLDVHSIVGLLDEATAPRALVDVVGLACRRPGDQSSLFDGVLLANWHRTFATPILNVLIRVLTGLNLVVYLEVSPPDYLTADECSSIDMEPLGGIICRNGTILRNGAGRDYYQMAELRRAQRAIAKHASMGGHYFLLWETIDDDVSLSPPVVKRSFNWCRYYTTVTWIAPESALTDADVAVAKTLAGEPMGALMWLKSNEVLEVHDLWRKNVYVSRLPLDHSASYESLHDFLPGLSSQLAVLPPASLSGSRRQQSFTADLTWPSESQAEALNPLCFSADGQEWTGLGCFHTGHDCSLKDSELLLDGQRRLRDLDMLSRLQPEQLLAIAQKVKVMYDACSSWATSSEEMQAVLQLFLSLTEATGDDSDRLRIYVGLHSGFRLGLDREFWGLYEQRPGSEGMDIYISAKCGDRAGTILHTFLSSMAFNRAECLQAEIVLSMQTDGLNEDFRLPPRVVQDLQQMTPSELMLLLRRISVADCGMFTDLSEKIQACCEHQLIAAPTAAQLRMLSTSDYLRGDISAESLVESRLAWLSDQGCHHPNPQAAIAVFKEIDLRVPHALLHQQSQHLAQLETVLQSVIRKHAIDASADILALAVFCAFRKLAVGEIYLEVLDRNPLPNMHPDQPACFAEMFALGSQCEGYLDMTPNVLGRILADQTHAYYSEHQPPYRDNKSTELPTSYASKAVDEDPDADREKVPLQYQVTFLGIFAVPALIDILLLTTLGRGLYLSTYMDETAKSMATAGLMVGLLQVGAIGAWIGHGGSYYLHCMAFPAMNMFVLTRFTAGIALSTGLGFSAFIIIGIVKGFYAGFIFFFYFATLATYLTILATLSVYQFPGFTFQSGRTVIVSCLPILLISPILTLWVHQDIIIYPCVLIAFLIALIRGMRKVVSQWSNWYLQIPSVSDTEIVEWYTKVQGSEVVLPEGVTDLSATPLPRKAITTEVLKERHRPFWKRSTEDVLVKKLASGYSATMFLMDWYCKYSRTKMPYKYSATWNLQCKTAIDTIKEMQKGLKLHDSFIHWRHGGDEVWCGLLYFIVALMDKWFTLLSGGALVGLSAADNSQFRLAVGFGLAYYLTAAVCLDSVAQPLWPMAHKKTEQPIRSLAFLREAAFNDATARRKLYWSNLLRFFFLHIWGVSVTAALLWVFQESRVATLMYIAYTCSYTGLLWYQYNRIYTGTLAMKDLIIAALVGIVAGSLFIGLLPNFHLGAVSTLGCASWTAAVLSIRTANIGWPKKLETQEGMTGMETVETFHCSTSGPDPVYSQRVLSDIYNAACAIMPEYRRRVETSSHPGVEVLANLESSVDLKRAEGLHEAFSSTRQLLRKTVALWKSGHVVVDLVPAGYVFGFDQKMRSITRLTGEDLHVIVVLGLDRDISANCKAIAEALEQAVAETKLGFTHSDSVLAELLVHDCQDTDELPLPAGLKRQLEWSTAERTRIIKTGHREMLRHALLGLDSELDWDQLPGPIRSLLLERVCGRQSGITTEQVNWIRLRLGDKIYLGTEEYIARCNLGVTLASLVRGYAMSLEMELIPSDRPGAIPADHQRYLGLAGAKEGDDDYASVVVRLFHRFLQVLRMVLKFTIVSLVADPVFQRELDYVVSGKNLPVRWGATFLLNGIWLYCKTLQRIVLPWFLVCGALALLLITIS